MSIGPAQPPPPQQVPQEVGGPPDIYATMLAQAPDLLSDAVQLISQRTGAPPDEVEQRLQTMPVDQRNALLASVLKALQAQLAQGDQGQPPPDMPPPTGPGGPPPGPPMAGPMPPPPGMMGGPPPGGPMVPPPSSPLEGPPVQPGGPSPLPSPEGARQPQPEQQDYLAQVPKEEKDPPPPDDWEPEALSDLHDKNYAWRDKPTAEEICKLAQDALDDGFWQDRNQACFDQSWCYYRSRLWAKHNGLPFSFVGGDLVYMLSTPSKQVDRIVARTQPRPDNLTFSLPPRSEREEYVDAAQKVENAGRDWWRKHCAAWWDNLAQTRPGATLERTLTHLDVLHGAVGFSIRPDIRRRSGTKKRDINAHHPLVIDIIPQHELYLLGDCTLRIQSVTLKEARRLSRVVRERWPSRTKQQEQEREDGKWWPPDDHPSRLISMSDEFGKWYAQCFDLVLTDTQRGQLGRDDEDQHWTIPPEQIDYGFCLFQLPPGWQSTGDNALPDDRQAAENYGKNFARGALFVNIEDFYHQDQVASAAISAFRYNRNPAGIDKIDYAKREASGVPLPDPMNVAEGGRNTRDKDEDYQFIPKHFADNPADNFAISMSFSQTSDTFPAAMGGGGQAASGYDRRQMVENAQLLHVEEIRNHVAGIVAHITRLSLQLLYRYGTGKKPKFSEIPFRQSSGGVGEAVLGMKDIEKAGVDVEVSYYEEDIEADLRKNNIYLPRLQAGVISKETTRELLDVPEPDKEEERSDNEFAVTHPQVQMARALLAMTRTNNPLLPFLREAAAMEKAGGGGPGGVPMPPGMPSISGGPPGGQETVARGMPPGMPMPPGL